MSTHGGCAACPHTYPQDSASYNTHCYQESAHLEGRRRRGLLRLPLLLLDCDADGTTTVQARSVVTYLVRYHGC